MSDKINVKNIAAVNKNTYSKAGHLCDQMLKYDVPTRMHISLFDNLLADTRRDIEKHVDKKEYHNVVVGINLSAVETRLIDCFCKLLHLQNKNINYTDDNILRNRMFFEEVIFSGNRDFAPKLYFSLRDICKEFYSTRKSGNIGNTDVNFLKQTIENLGRKRFLIRYTENTYYNNKTRRKRYIESFKPIIEILTLNEEFYENDVEVYTNKQCIVLLSPIFIRQINSKFILYPNDINEITNVAYGRLSLGKRIEIPYGIIKLRDYLLRSLSYKEYHISLMLSTLYYLVADKEMKKRAKTLAMKKIKQAIEVCMNMNLLLEYEEIDNLQGDIKYIFHIKKNYYKYL